MHVVYDVSHNIAKIEEHLVEGKIKQVRTYVTSSHHYMS